MSLNDVLNSTTETYSSFLLSYPINDRLLEASNKKLLGFEATLLEKLFQISSVLLQPYFCLSLISKSEKNNVI